jgi:hypothetical protein
VEPVKLIQNTLRWLKENPDQWCQGTAVDKFGRHCAVGVMSKMSGEDGSNVLPALALVGNSSKYKYGDRYLSSINDRFGYDAVIEVLEKTVADNTESLQENESDQTKELEKV